MLQLTNISKSYTTGGFTQQALDNVSISFRDNEFVAVLGPSGSGKTTLLNIIGGLDHYDEGDLVIEGVSTKKYKDRDWDTYRNNRIGFVFQSYNLIPHQTVLSNVELALTLSGVSRDERRKRAKEALQRVGLGDHMNKKPSQMSGGQMQRVAIARALINDPEILLADEPTGALDSKTSVQIMDLLTEIADDRLVIMVTHNPELAEQYATRIVNLADGHILSDSCPYDPTQEETTAAHAKATRRTRMGFLTALSLSANNLLTKKGRTIMTAVAGSIGIIGIAAILALANGVNNYIKNVEEETLSVYPLEIMSTGFDMTSLLVGMGADIGSSEETEDATANSATADTATADSGTANTATAGNSTDVQANDTTPTAENVSLRDQMLASPEEGKIGEANVMTRMFASIGSNDLAALKEYFDSGKSGIDTYANSVYYEYAVTPQIFDAHTKKGVRQVNPDTSFASLGFGSGASSNSLVSMSMSTDMFAEMMDNNQVIADQYDVVAGTWPQEYNELMLVLTQSGKISDFTSYVLGLRDSDELKDMVKQFLNEENVDVPTDQLDISYDDVLGLTFKLVNATDYYKYDEDHAVWIDKTDDEAYLKKLVKNGEDLTIVGIAQPKADAKAIALQSGIYYTPALTRHLVEQATKTRIVKDQLADSKRDVFTGKTFDEMADDQGEDFDMSTLFSVNEEVLTNAFNIDQSALTSGISGLDLDLSKLKIKASDLPAFDASSLSKGIDPKAAAGAMDALDISKLLDPSALSNIDLSNIDMQDAIDASQLASSIQDVMSMEAVQKWAAENPGAWTPSPDPMELISNMMSAYMASEEVQAALAQGIQSSIDTKQLGDDIGQAVQTQITGALTTQMQQKVIPAIVTAIQKTMMKEIKTKLETAMKSYMEKAMSSVMNTMAKEIKQQLNGAMSQSMAQLSANMASAMTVDTDAFMNAFEMNMNEDELTELVMSLMVPEDATYDNNLKKLGYADFDKPSEISIYPIDFESKEHIIEILDSYNDRMRASDEEKVISYTDIVGTLMTSVTDIVNMISYVLIAFVAISLIVSSIMIGVITYISVLERIKEIGILRSIGASKGDISRIFNAETIIEGLISGLLGVGVTALGCIPANIIVYDNFGVADVAILPTTAAIILVAISVVLSFIAGVIPSRSASRKDPVEALRSE